MLTVSTHSARSASPDALCWEERWGGRCAIPTSPSPTHTPDDAANVLDHFYVKLLRISSTMTTTSGRAEAHRRTEFMYKYLRQLGREIQADHGLEEDF